jgi:hypothetical protein
MGILRLPGLTQSFQPQGGPIRLSRSYPLHPNIVGAWLATPSGMVDLLGRGLNSVATANQLSVVTKNGLAIGSAAAGKSAQIPYDARYLPTAAMSAVYVGVCATTGSNGSTEVSNNGFGFGYLNGSNRVYCRIGAAWADQPTNTALGSSGVWGFTYDGALFAAYSNGVRQATQSISGAITHSASGFPLNIAATGTNPGDGKCNLLLFFDCALTQRQWASIADNPWQVIEDRQRGLMLAAAGGAAALAGTATASANATGALSTSIVLSGAASAQATATGTIATGIALAGAATCAATATAALSTSIRLTGSASSTATSSGALTTAIVLTGSATAAATATGALTAPGAGMSGSATCTATASGALTTSIALAGNATASAAASGALTAPGAGLSGSASCSAAASGALTTAIALSGSASATAAATGALAGNAIALSGTATCRATATGSLTTGIALRSAAGASVFASGVLTTAIRLSGSATCVASAAGGLTGGTFYTRAPSGSGYSPRHVPQQDRPTVVSDSLRPAATQGRDR